MVARLVLLLCCTTSAAFAAVASYELRGERRFENSIDVHACRQLHVGGRAIAWVFGLASTSVGLVAKICQEEPIPPGEMVTPGSTYGGTREGRYVFDVNDGQARRLTLPGLNEFSNPTWCNRFGAYWGSDNHGNHSLVLADLKSRKSIRRVPNGRLTLATDYVGHLAPATWSKDCETATFSDERYLEKAITLAATD